MILNMLKRLLSPPGIALILILIIGLTALLRETQYMAIPFWIMCVLALAVILMFSGSKNPPEN